MFTVGSNMYICRIIFNFLICLIHLCLPVVADQLLLVSSQLGQHDFCITNSSSAMYYTTDSGEVGTEETSLNFSPSLFCDFEKVQNKDCGDYFQQGSWSRTSSFEIPILDVRWENFPIKKPLYDDERKLNYVSLLEFNGNGFKKISMSLIGQKANLLLCDKNDFVDANCYWIEFRSGAQKFIGIRKCFPIVAKGNNLDRSSCSDEMKTKPSDDSTTYLNDKTWTHIIIERQQKNIYLKTYNKGKEIQILRFTEQYSINSKLDYLLGQSDDSKTSYKVHENHFMRTTDKTIETFPHRFNSTVGGFCASIFLITCPICFTSVLLLDEVSKDIISRKDIAPTNGIWQNYKISVENSRSHAIAVRLETKLSNGDYIKGGEFWAFDNFRECRKKEYRITQKTSEKIWKCRLLANDMRVEMVDAIENYESVVKRPSSIYLGSCDILGSFGKNCDFLKICENRMGSDNVCYCSRGYTGSQCDKECEIGTYGYFCQTKCGFCSPEGMCDNKDGSCKKCNDLFEGQGCHIPKDDLYLRNAPKVINNGFNFCDIEWKWDHVGRTEAKYYQIQYTNEGNTMWQDFGENEMIPSDDTSGKATIRYLDSNKTYKIRVLISNSKNRLKNLADINLPYTFCTTTNNEPEKPYNVSVVWDLNNFMEIRWNYPDRRDNIPKGFRIFVLDQDDQVVPFQEHRLNYNYRVPFPAPPAVVLHIRIIAYYNKNQTSEPVEIEESSYPTKPQLENSKSTITNYTETTININLDLTQVRSNSLGQYLFILIDDQPLNQKDRNLHKLEEVIHLTFDMTSRLRIVAEFNLRKLPNNINFTLGDGKEQKENDILNENIVNKPLREVQCHNVTILMLNEYKKKYQYNLYKLPSFDRKMTTHPCEENWIEKYLPPQKKAGEKESNTSGFAAYSLLSLLLLIPIMIWIMIKRKSIVLVIPMRSFWKLLDAYSSNIPSTEENDEGVLLNIDEMEVKFQMPVTEVPQKLSISQSENSPDDSYSKPVKMADFEEYVKSSIDSEELERQHALFPRGQTQSWQCGSTKINKPKNRYKNLVAYDHSRVILEKIDGDEYSDYINANYVHGVNIERAYIATQGPISTTLHDFWRMIWQDNVRHIVMLANIYEGGKVKNEQYWPNINEELTFQDIVVRCQSMALFANFEQRLFIVIKGDEKREVKQLHFTSWPDHGVPLYPQSLVAFLNELLNIPLSSTSPIVIHCSAGIGRTGTILLSDISLRRAAKQGVVDMLNDLHNLRKQRANMVDNVLQYKLAHLVVLECLMGLRTSIPCNENMDKAVQKLIRDEDYKVQMNYLKETEWQDKAMKIVARIMDEPPNYPEKNRVQEIIPDNVGRISLARYPPEDESSSYINAVEVDGYRCPGRFLITQQPMPNTLGDFWRLVTEKEIKVIISLNEVDLAENTSCKFWPTADDPELRPVDFLVVKFGRVTEMRNFDMYSLHVWMKDGRQINKEKLDVVVVSFKNWHSKSAIPPSCEDFLSFYAETEKISRKSTKVIVTCFDGVTASGMYAALSFMIEQIMLEQKCDVCFAVRTIRHNRKQFVTNEVKAEEAEQKERYILESLPFTYTFCYQTSGDSPSFSPSTHSVFEPNNDDNEDAYHKIFDEYKNLVDFMLGNFMEDIGITPAQFEYACFRSRQQHHSLRFDQSTFEQIWAANNYEMFKRMMTQRNVELQLQALELIEQKYGIMPQSFVPSKKETDVHIENQPKEGLSKINEQEDMEKVILNEVAKKFVEEETLEAPEIKSLIEEKEILECARDKISSEISKTEVKLISKEEEKVVADIKDVEKAELTKSKDEATNDGPSKLPSAVVVTSKNVEKVDNYGIKPSTVKQIDQLDMKKRQEYLRKQRDKLVALKKEERRRQFGKTEDEDIIKKTRPKSAKAAQAVLTGEQSAIPFQELQLRKALAERLKMEVVDKNKK